MPTQPDRLRLELSVLAALRAVLAARRAVVGTRGEARRLALSAVADARASADAASATLIEWRRINQPDVHAQWRRCVDRSNHFHR